MPSNKTKEGRPALTHLLTLLGRSGRGNGIDLLRIGLVVRRAGQVPPVRGVLVHVGTGRVAQVVVRVRGVGRRRGGRVVVRRGIVVGVCRVGRRVLGVPVGGRRVRRGRHRILGGGHRGYDHLEKDQFIINCHSYSLQYI